MMQVEWGSCTDPQRMLEFLSASGRASARKLRLYAVACCRRVWHLLTDRRSSEAVEVAERYADGLSTQGKLSACLGAVRAACREADARSRRGSCRALAAALAAHGASCVASTANSPDLIAWVAREAAYYAASATATAAEVSPPGEIRSVAYRAERSAQHGLLLDIYGNPFRDVQPMTPSPLAWNGCAVMQLAQAAYEERVLPEGLLDPTRLAVLADALEEAGCANEDVLQHLRQQGQGHVRGCWAVDLLLGKREGAEHD